MKIKSKLFWGLGTLFSMIVLLTATGILFINQLSADAGNILEANYNTLDYSRKMMLALNEGIDQPENLQLFEENLKKQRENITEAGEQELTRRLASDFSAARSRGYSGEQIRQLQKDVSHIMLLNMQAIQRKSRIAGETSDRAVFWIAVAGTICFLVAFTLLVNLPGNIANPIRELTESIREIAAQNYTKRVHFQQKDEFGEMAASFNSMAEKLQEFQQSNVQKLMLEKKRIEALIGNMKDPVIGLDEKGIVLFMNEAAFRIAGMAADAAIGKPIQSIAEKNDLVRSLISDMNSAPASSSKQTIKIYTGNKEGYFEKEIIPIKIIPTGEQEDKQVGTVILLQNITAYKELDFAKTNFIATVSHELKTPISSIKMSVQLLKNKQIGGLNEEQSQLVNGIAGDADRLLKITGELLNMAQVETGSIQLSVAPTSVSEILEPALLANRIAAQQKSIRVETELPNGISKVLADRDKTNWVLNNLLSNAIRYSYENAVVKISAWEEAGFVCLSVADGGQGIAPRYLPRVFDRYFRIPGSRKEGTGLGLSISKEFMEAQGGEITVESEYGSGTVFTVKLPRNGSV